MRNLLNTPIGIYFSKIRFGLFFANGTQRPYKFHYNIFKQQIFLVLLIRLTFSSIYIITDQFSFKLLVVRINTMLSLRSAHFEIKTKWFQSIRKES